MTAAPGPWRVCALTLSGLPSDRFLFAGFPRAQGDRPRLPGRCWPVQATLILYESPKRVLRPFWPTWPRPGRTRQAAVCRELTKRFEEVARGTLAELPRNFRAETEGRGGAGRPRTARDGDDEVIEAALDRRWPRCPLRMPQLLCRKLWGCRANRVPDRAFPTARIRSDAPRFRPRPARSHPQICARACELPCGPCRRRRRRAAYEDRGIAICARRTGAGSRAKSI
jgi:hypothetical protein